MNLTDEVIGLEKEHLVQSYKRPPFVLVRGQGMTVYDATGKAYQDWVAGIAVNALGYAEPGMVDAIQTAATGLLHTSNLYYTEPQARLAAAICEKSFADRVFFTNSGTEANEGAIKFVRKYHYDRGDHDRKEIVCFSGAFHGRTLGALSLTPKDKYQKPFAPLMPGVVVAEFNDVASADAAITERTAAVIVEPVQGEGGINPATNEFLKALRRFCNERGALLIFDEVQAGMGRTGTLWSSDPSGVTPDIQVLAKALGGGMPIGAILATEQVAEHIHPGDHGTTYAGGPFITGVASYVFERISQPEFIAHVREVGDYLQERLQEINSPLVKEVRGRGLMVGLELTVEVAPIIEAGYQHGLLMVNAGTNVIRFVPPLIAEKQDVDTLIERLTDILATTGATV
ncbi:MAG: aspartate aminotransferase family protein [Anaerolineae bacterium]|nr:aspartate aminotransferase family protein [Anaerolineae bacterium]